MLVYKVCLGTDLYVLRALVVSDRIAGVAKRRLHRSIVAARTGCSVSSARRDGGGAILRADLAEFICRGGANSSFLPFVFAEPLLAARALSLNRIS